MSPRPPHMPSMPVGDLRKTLARQRVLGAMPVMISLPGGQMLALNQVSVDFRNGFFVMLLRPRPALRAMTAADLQRAIITAMDQGGAWGRNLGGDKQAVIEIPGGPVLNLDKVTPAQSGDLVLTAGDVWPPEEFR